MTEKVASSGGKVQPIRKRLPSNAAALADELGRLDSEMKDFKDLKKRYDQVRAQILSWYEEKPDDESFVVEGTTHSLLISERANARKIKSMPKLFKRLGEKLFLQLATFALKHVDEHIPITERKLYLSEAQTGPRSLKCVAKLTKAA